MSRVRDITGMKIGRLTVVRFAGKNKHNRSTWLCACECGKNSIVSGSLLLHKTKPTKSCGCLVSENFNNTTHRLSYSITYISWHAMKNRCLNPKQPCSKGYADRGIKIFEPWLTFSNFVADMGERPSRSYTLERIDNNGHYEPGNVRWATKKEQGWNRRTNLVVEINGVRKCVAEWAHIHGVHRNLVWNRIHLGWPPEKWFIEKQRKSTKGTTHVSP